MTKYSPRQLAVAFAKLLTHHKNSSKNKYSDKKIAWIKNTVNKVLGLIESEVKIYNKANNTDPIGEKDLIATGSAVLNTIVKAFSKK